MRINLTIGFIVCGKEGIRLSMEILADISEP